MSGQHQTWFLRLGEEDFFEVTDELVADKELSKKHIFVLLDKMSPGISDTTKKKLSDRRDGTAGNENMGNSKNKDTETEEENDNETPRIIRHWRAVAVAGMATI
eukprot:3920639-Ditylum_brightwellii.AAC.1